MPDLRIETMDISGEFQNFVVTTRLVQRCTRNFSTLVELTGIIEWLLQACRALHNRAIVYTGNGYCVETDRGNPLVLTSVLFIANLLYKRRVILTSSVVQLMLSWWRNLLSCREDWPVAIIADQ